MQNRRSQFDTVSGRQHVYRFIFGKEWQQFRSILRQALRRLAALFRLRRTPLFFAISDEHVVLARWLGDSAVEIALIPGEGQIFRSEQRVGDIKVIYLVAN
jgi:hypothetical protein